MRVFFLLIILYGIIANANPHEVGELRASETADALQPDPRCLVPEKFNRADTAAVERFNKLCEIEQEVIRLTNEHRKKNGLPALRANPQLSYVVRYQAGLTLNTRNAHAHFHNHIPSYYYGQWFPTGRKIFMARENAAWGWRGSDAKGIAFSLADDPVNGWNHHAGHKDNVAAADVTDIGVGVDIRSDGTVVAYTVFAKEQP